jgi:hypothetical protein
LPQVSVREVGENCARSLLEGCGGKSSPYCYKLFGPEPYSSTDIKRAVEEVTGREVELHLIEREQLANFFGQQVPGPYVGEFTEMIIAALPGGIIIKDFAYDEDTITGKVAFVDIMREVLSK